MNNNLERNSCGLIYLSPFYLVWIIWEFISAVCEVCFVFQADDKAVFHEEFVRCLKYAMVIYKREPAVERVIEFAAKFVTSFHQSDVEDDEDEKDGGILNYLFTFLLKVL